LLEQPHGCTDEGLDDVYAAFLLGLCSAVTLFAPTIATYHYCQTQPLLAYQASWQIAFVAIHCFECPDVLSESAWFTCKTIYLLFGRLASTSGSHTSVVPAATGSVTVSVSQPQPQLSAGPGQHHQPAYLNAEDVFLIEAEKLEILRVWSSRVSQ
jgi:hypothetical protein